MTPTQIIVDETPSTAAVAGDLDRVAFVEWLYTQPPTWTAQAESVSHNPLALWFAAQGYCLVQVGFTSAWLNFGTVDETWLRMGDWGTRFLDACIWLADYVGRNSLTRDEVLWAINEADWAFDATMVLNRKDLPAA